MMISKGAVPAVHVSYADRYFDISRVFTWSPNPKGRSISTRRNYGRCFSAGPQPNDDDDDDDTASSMLLDDLRVRMFAFIARRVGNEYVRQVESSKRPETRPKLKAEQPHQQHQTILPSPHKTHLVIEINSRSPVAKKRPLPSSFQSSSIPPTTHSNGGHVGSGPPLTHPPSRTHPISTLAARLEHKQQQQQQHKQQRVHAAPIVQVTTTANPPATAKRGQATVVAASSPPGLSPSESESGSGANVLWVVHSR
ncbi:hypothetical protein DFJ77DRAFT_26380 [Powellomyces hirtus]|nr:hypothetical protein DFJ77DRAFT_26380 [Powellomyces hirtus]